MSDPVDLIEAMMIHWKLSRADLIDVFGTRSRACEVLARKRKLNLRMIRRLVDWYGLPAELLIQDYELKP